MIRLLRNEPALTASPDGPPDRLAAAVADRYRIERELGAGGMATVYLAEDLRHRRKVAMKVLRAELAASLGPDRFVGEIEVLARLTHPHILPLHDSGAADGFLFYVMPYVEGESLRTRLDRAGEMPVGEVVRILYEVADALSYAHELGVVHRDIKPDNVMLSGRHALVMDFGVAKALSAATGRHAITTAGIALGTPAYMAPEQAAADPGMDHRVDLYALGAMGYEMLTGMPPFTGRTAQEVLSAHVTREPAPVAERRPGTPSALADLIMGCLAKRPADRWQSAEEVRQRLEALVTPSGGITPTTTRPVAAVVRPAGRRTRLVMAGVALLVLLVAAFAYVTLRSGAESVELGRRVQVTLGPELDLDPALSPDGRLIAYASGTAGDTRIYVRQVEGGAAVAVAADVPGRQRAPRWSPDGGSILFSSGRGLHVVPALGGMSRMVVDAGAAGGVVDAAWSPDGRSIAYIRGDSLIRRQIETGAERGLAEGGGLMLASWSPDGRWIALADGNRGFMYGTRFLGDLAPARIVLIPGEGGEPVEVAGGGSLNTSPAWLRSDALLYVSNRDGARDVYLQRLDRRGAPSGDPRRLTVGLGAHAVSVSADGTALAYATLVESVNVWSLPFGAGGALDTALLRPETREQQVVEGFDISRDGRWLVFDSNRDGHQQIFRAALDGGTVQQLTRGAGDSFIPRLSPDGREIVFHSYQPGTRKLFIVPADGGPLRQITAGTGHDIQPAWSPDGAAVVFEHRTPDTVEVQLVRRRGAAWGDRVTLSRRSEPTPGGSLPSFSPDGRSVLFVDPESASMVPVTGGSARRVFHAPNLRVLNAAWAPDGRSIYVIVETRGGSASIWEAPLDGAPRQLVTFDGTERQPTRYGLVVRRGRLYLTYGERQADLSVVSLAPAD